MRNRALYFATLLAALLAIEVIPQYAQNAQQSIQAQRSRRNLAVSLLRSINTAELVHQSKNGVYANWETLLATDNFAEYALRPLTRFDLQLSDAQFSKQPEILPGWMLRLNLIDGGAGYDVELEDATDKACHYAASSDERAVIR